MYIADMYRGVIEGAPWAKEGTYLREKIKQYQLDKVLGHGRVWRLTYEGMTPDRTKPRMLEQTPRSSWRTCRIRTAGGVTRRSSCSSSSRIESVVPALGEAGARLEEPARALPRAVDARGAGQPRRGADARRC